MAQISINIASGTIDKQEKSEIIIGIDLGTTNSLVAYMRDGQPHAVKDPEGTHTLVPSVIHFDASNKVQVGEAAKAQLLEAPERTIYSVKRLMGKSFKDISDFEHHFSYKVIDEDEDKLVKVRIGDSFYTPIELSAQILSRLKARVEQALGQNVERAVITVPAYFNDAQRQATRDAGRLAGLDVLRIVNEPTAASLAYGIGQDRDKEQLIAVYDLGGGTFDLSILRIDNGVFEVLSTHGDTFLGGDDFDRIIVEHWMQTLEISSETLNQDKSLAQALRLAAEAAKKALSTAPSFTQTVGQYTLDLTQAKFEALAEPLVQRTLSACRQALKDAKVKKAAIDEVVMVGGSTRMKVVKEAVQNFFGRQLHDALNPDEVVALGAAVQADILAGNNKDFLLLDITPLSLGIETVGGLMDVIIPRNSKVPTRVGRNYTTSVDGQTNLKVSVYQGERDMVADNRKLGEFVLRGIPPMPAGIPKIQIQFILNADGILKVRALEERSGTEQSIEIRSQYGISEEDMARMLKDSIVHAKEDMARRALIEARTEAQNIIQSTEKFMRQHADILTATEIEGLKKHLAQLITATEGEDKNAIQTAMDELNTFSSPFAHRAMDKTVAAAMKGKNIQEQSTEE